MSAAQGTELVRYDAMCRAIAAAHEIDEVADIRDKARAIELYMAQRNNVEAEFKACEIRLRAERKLGQMLSQMEKPKGGRPSVNPSTDTRGLEKSLSQLGISYDQSSRWQKLAAIPQDDFEATFGNAERKPSTNGILREHAERVTAQPDETPVEPPRREPVRSEALWLWGRLLDFERNGLLEIEPCALFSNMLDHMQDTTRELAPRVIAWLERLPK